MQTDKKENILLIGNGFDLYHNLNTKYTDFMDFIKDTTLIEQTISKHQEKLKTCTSEEQCFHKPALDLRIRNLERFKDEINNNIIIKYFSQDLDYTKSGWIDFEKKIENMLLDIDDYYSKFLILYKDENISKKYNNVTLDGFFKDIGEKAENNINQRLKRIKNINKNNIGFFIEKLYTLGLVKRIIIEEDIIVYESYNYDELDLPNYEIENIIIKSKSNIIELILRDFNRLIECFNTYLIEFVDIKKIKVFSEQVREMDIDKVLTFNYTDTFRIYKELDRKSICHVHGKTSIYPDKVDMVMGTSEDAFDSIEGNDKKLEYIRFQKYFQRIFKNTGAEYKKWMYEEYMLHIIGHSLDVTDKEIIFDMIDFSEKTYIYYNSEESFARLITNLVRIAGRNDAIEWFHDKIKFIPLRKPVEDK